MKIKRNLILIILLLYKLLLEISLHEIEYSHVFSIIKHIQHNFDRNFNEKWLY